METASLEDLEKLNNRYNAVGVHLRLEREANGKTILYLEGCSGESVIVPPFVQEIRQEIRYMRDRLVHNDIKDLILQAPVEIGSRGLMSAYIDNIVGEENITYVGRQGMCDLMLRNKRELNLSGLKEIEAHALNKLRGIEIIRANALKFVPFCGINQIVGLKVLELNNVTVLDHLSIDSLFEIEELRLPRVTKIGEYALVQNGCQSRVMPKVYLPSCMEIGVRAFYNARVEVGVKNRAVLREEAFSSNNKPHDIIVHFNRGINEARSNVKKAFYNRGKKAKIVAYNKGAFNYFEGNREKMDMQGEIEWKH